MMKGGRELGIPTLVLGTMTFGQQVFGQDAEDMVQAFLDSGYNELDTAYVYNNGDCETILGDVLSHLGRENFKIATKVNPRITGKLDADSIRTQLEASLLRMRVSSVDLLYLHFPDASTPLVDTLKACNMLHSEGKFTELGMSNYAVADVRAAVKLCNENGWKAPTVYEGVYNALSRNVEAELMPALKELGLRFTGYNPLAGGMLTGRYRSLDETPGEGRFTFRPNYQQRYWQQSYFDAVNMLISECENEGIKLVDAAYRWLLFHSALDGDKNDAIIIGASKLSQLKSNLASRTHGQLSDNLVRAFDRAWETTQDDAPEYYRYYNA